MDLLDTITTSTYLTAVSNSWSKTNSMLEESYSRDSLMNTYIASSTSIVTNGITGDK